MMEWLLQALGLQSRPPPPEPCEGDIIYPLFFLDNEPNLRKAVATWMMRFNDVLDYGVLHAALVKVLETGDWRKLGGRLAQKDNKFYVYSPAAFTPQRPAVNFSHDKFDVEIRQHPLGKLMPEKASLGQPSLNNHIKTFLEPLAMSPTAPKEIEDYLSRDVPMLSLHIVSFEDATLVSVSWPHAVMDALSLQGVMKAWSIALSGKHVSEIPALVGAREDVLDEFADEKVVGRKDLRLQPRRLRGLGLVMFVAYFLYETVFGPAMNHFIVPLSKAAVDGLRKEVEADLGSLQVQRDDDDNDNDNDEEDDASTNNKKPKDEVSARISSGDILVSWFIHNIISGMSKPRPFISRTFINLRNRVTASSTPGPSCYIQNMIVLSIMNFSGPAAAAASIGQIARQHRHNLMAQATPEQLIAYLQTMRREAGKRRYPLIVAGEPNSLFINSTNWTIVDIYGVVDFGPAVIRTGEAPSTRSNPPGTVLYHFAGALRNTAMVRNWLSIYGRDHEGTYWLGGYVDSRTLSKMEESIRKLPS